MPRSFSNTAVETTLQTGISAAATTLTVGSTSGYPVSFPYRLTIDYETAPAEVVEVTAAVGTTLTVIRGVDGTPAGTHDMGARVVHTATAQDFRDSQVHIAASADVHGLTAGAAVVGTSSSQTLTNKTIDGAGNTLQNLPAAQVTGNHRESAFVATAVGGVPVLAKGMAGQTGNLLEFRNTGGTLLGSVDKDGKPVFGDGSFTGTLSAHLLRPTATAVGDVPLIVKAMAGQTGDLFQSQTSAGAVGFVLNEAGIPEIQLDGNISNRALRMMQGATERGYINGVGGASFASDRLLANNDAQFFATPSVEARSQDNAETFSVRAHSTQTKDLTQWKNSAGTVLAKTQIDGQIVAPNLPANNWAQAYRTASMNTLTGTWALVLPHSASLTQAAGWTINSGLVCPEAGTYDIDGQVQFDANATGARRVMLVLNSNGTDPATGTAIAVVTAQTVSGLSAYVPVRAPAVTLAAADKVQLYAWQNSGATIALSAGADQYTRITRIR